ncbi:hypothetical protein BES34_003870 [Leptospira inadai serovar Lyme]|uniref:Uncharacterized protein n=1 Tax=Leptospira inadai serovar Lyme TaxID=293084 RepID=A0ABX4YLQ5_9LEPT|nr:hypothetical protein BES34_003870 [Leptospira inadai serovar Lyme]
MFIPPPGAGFSTRFKEVIAITRTDIRQGLSIERRILIRLTNQLYPPKKRRDFESREEKKIRFQQNQEYKRNYWENPMA